MPDEEHRGASPPPEPSPNRAPPVWPAFVAFVVAVAFSLVAQFVIGVLIGVWYVATGGNAQRLAADLPDLLATTPAFVTYVLAIQGAFLATALAAARIAPAGPGGGLGFVRAVLPAWGYPALAVGSLIPLAVGAGAMEAVSRVAPMDQTLERVFGQVTMGWAVPFVLFLALVPGFVEEAFFRGYIQRRLLARWPAWLAIVAAAGLFGLMHIYPAQIAFAFVVGLWLGVVAWRAGSVWPAVLCHASINAASGVWNLGTRFGVIPDPLPDAALGVGIVLALGCFLISLWLLTSGQSIRRPEAVVPDARAR